jgi:hypothetical protein
MTNKVLLKYLIIIFLVISISGLFFWNISQRDPIKPLLLQLFLTPTMRSEIVEKLSAFSESRVLKSAEDAYAKVSLLERIDLIFTFHYLLLEMNLSEEAKENMRLLFEKGRTDESPEVRTMYVACLPRVYPSDVINRVSPMLDDESLLVQRITAVVLGKYGDERGISTLINMLGMPVNEEFRAEALERLQEITGEDFTETNEWQEWWNKQQK